jgi:hypothetical protein
MTSNDLIETVRHFIHGFLRAEENVEDNAKEILNCIKRAVDSYYEAMRERRANGGRLKAIQEGILARERKEIVEIDMGKHL